MSEKTYEEEFIEDFKFVFKNEKEKEEFIEKVINISVRQKRGFYLLRKWKKRRKLQSKINMLSV